jgi:hypothetical protein
MRKDEDIYAIIDSLKKVAALHPKKMFCAFSGSVDRPEEALHRKIERLEKIKNEVERGVQAGISPRELQRKLLGRGDQFSFITSGYMSKKNLINAFLKRSPRDGASRK